MNFNGPQHRLVDTDLPRIGALIGCGEDEIHAFLDVETRGGGYDRQGRPKMLFEPHKFYGHTSGKARARAVAAGLAYPNWGEKPYPADSYPRLLAATEIDAEAALKSASWGIGQVLGENHVAAGYDTVEAMVRGFVDLGEAEQLEAAVRFIKANRLDDELRTHNFAAFARGYNGPLYAEHGYHLKLAAAFKKWAAIRDTPWSPTIEQSLRMAVNATPDHPVVASPAILAANGEPIVVKRAAPPDPASKPAILVDPAAAKPSPEGFFASFWRGLAALTKGA